VAEDNTTLLQWDPNAPDALNENRDWSGLADLGLDKDIFTTLQAEKRAEFFGKFEHADALGLDATIFDRIATADIADAEMTNTNSEFGQAWLEGATALYREMNPGLEVPQNDELSAWAEEQVSRFDNRSNTEDAINFSTPEARTAVNYLSELNVRTEREWSDRGRGFMQSTVLGVWEGVTANSEGIADEAMYDRDTAFGDQYLKAAEILYNEKNHPHTWEQEVQDRQEAANAAAEGWNFNDFNPFAETDKEYAANFDADKELAEYAKAEAVWFENNKLGQWTTNGTFMSDGISAEAQQALSMLVEMDKFTEGDWGDTGQMLWASVRDPSQIAAGAAMTGAAALAIATAPISGTVALVAGGASVVGIGALEGGMSEHYLNTGVQNLRLSAGDQTGGFDYAERTSARRQGYVTGAVAAPAFALGGLGVKKAVKASGVGEVISTTLASAFGDINIFRRGAEEAAKAPEVSTTRTSPADTDLETRASTVGAWLRDEEGALTLPPGLRDSEPARTAPDANSGAANGSTPKAERAADSDTTADIKKSGNALPQGGNASDTTPDYLLTKDGYYDNRVRGGVTAEIASETLQVTAPNGKKGTRTNSRTVKHFHNNLRDSVDRYQAALRKEGADFDVLHKQFQKEIVELHQSATRMGMHKGEKPGDFELSADGATLTYGTYESGINITRTQREGLRVTLDKALDLGVELRNLGSPAKVEDYMHDVAFRAQNIADRTPFITTLNARDALILASWKRGSNVGKNGKYNIGISNDTQIRLLRYTIEEAGDLYSRDAGPTPFTVINSENVGGRLRKLIKTNADKEDDPDTNNFGGNWPAYEQAANKVVGSGFEHGLTTADLIAELNMAVARTQKANPFVSFDDLLQQIEIKLAKSTKADGELVQSITHPDGRIEITDPAVIPMLKRLRAQEDLVWHKNNQGDTVKATWWGKSPEGSIAVDERTLRENASYSLNIKNSSLRFRAAPTGARSAAGNQLAAASFYRRLGVPLRLLWGDNLDIAETRTNIKTNGGSFSYAWQAAKGEEPTNAFAKMWQASRPGKFWNIALKRPARILYRIHGFDALPTAMRFMPDHWFNGNAQKYKFNNPMRAAYAINGVVAGSLLYATGSSPLLYTWNLVDDVKNGNYWSAISPFHDSAPSPDNSDDNNNNDVDVDAQQLAVALLALKNDQSVEKALKDNLGYDDAQLVSEADIVEEIRNRAANLIASNQVIEGIDLNSHPEAHRQIAAKLATYQHFMLETFNALGIPGNTGNPTFDMATSRVMAEGVDPTDSDAVFDIIGVTVDMNSRFNVALDALNAEQEALDAEDRQHPAVIQRAAQILAQTRQPDANGIWSFAYDPSSSTDRASAIESANRALDITNDGVFDQDDVEESRRSGNDASGNGIDLSGVRDAFTDNGAYDLVMSQGLGRSVFNMANTLTDGDGDGVGWIASSSTGRALTHMVGSVGGGITGAFNDLSSDTKDNLKFAGMGIGAAFLLRFLPGFSWTKNGLVFTTLAIVAGFFFARSTRQGGNEMPGTFAALAGQGSDTNLDGGPMDDRLGTGDTEETGGDAQGSGGFIAAAEATAGVRLQSHGGELPKMIEFDLDEDGEIDITLVDDNQDGMFVAQVADVNSGGSFVAPKMIDASKFTTSTRFAPMDNKLGITDASADQSITIELIDDAGNENKSVLTINGQTFEMPLIAADELDAYTNEMELQQS